MVTADDFMTDCLVLHCGQITAFFVPPKISALSLSW